MKGNREVIINDPSKKKLSINTEEIEYKLEYSKTMLVCEQSLLTVFAMISMIVILDKRICRTENFNPLSFLLRLIDYNF